MHSGWSAGKQPGNSFCDSGTSWPLPGLTSDSPEMPGTIGLVVIMQVLQGIGGEFDSLGHGFLSAWNIALYSNNETQRAYAKNMAMSRAALSPARWE